MTLTKRTLTAAFALALGVASLLPAQAGQLDNRFDRQQHRINQGVSSGRINHGEYVSDERRLHRDERMRNRDLRRHDGKLTGLERARLNQRLNHSSNQIYRTKHNEGR